jgi:alkylation response protein AidB-like acyl-CoA dehydrogenase
MDIGFSEEQELLRETSRKFLESECDSRFVRERMATAEAVTDTFWRELAEQGWLGIVYSEDDGGSGLGLVDLVVLMEEMGRRVMPGPFLSSVLLGGAAIAEAGSPAQCRGSLPARRKGRSPGPSRRCAGTPPESRCRRGKQAAASPSPAASCLSATPISPKSW